MARTGLRRRRGGWRRLRGLVGILVLGTALLVGVANCAIDRALNRVTAPPAAVSAEARQIHDSFFVIDLHADPLIWTRDLAQRAEHGHVDLPRLREGGVALQVFGSVTKTPWGMNFESNSGGTDMMTSLVFFQGRPRRTWGSLFERSLEQAGRLQRLAAESGGGFRILRNRRDLERFVADRTNDHRALAGLLAIEGAHALEGKLENLDGLFEAGYRMIGLAHFFDNEVAGSAHGAQKGGLTPFGEQVVARMEALGVAVDLAHTSPRAIDDVLARATRPLVVSHTGVKGTCDSPRNLSDDQLRRIAATGGVIGIGYFPGAVCGKDVASIVRAFHYARGVVGAGALAFGSDWDGATSTPFDAAGLPRLTEALLADGFTPEELRGIAGENALRVLRVTLPE